MDVLFMLAVLPAAVLLWYVWKADPVEKEPPGLLLRLLLCGVLSTIPAILLEIGFSMAFPEGETATTLGAVAFQNFIGVALIEEGCKYYFLKGRTWNDSNFDYVFDGIVYAVFVGLGFAIAENINYVFSYGFETGVVRAFTAIPGHCVFAVFMGYFYGKAKHAQAAGHGVRKAWFGLCAIAVPIFCHGTYDTLATIGTDDAELAFFAFLLLVVFIGYRLVKRTSAKAQRIR